jgi:ATP phosphoribosyltransferase regulatory subunit
MTDRLPSGTRDVLPDEMRELREMTDRVRAVFERAGYGEVYTPALEYESTFDRRDREATTPAYRMFDEQGNVLVLRSEMTLPIARLVANRYQHVDPPHRFCYFAHAYRGVRPQRGQSREFLQAGVELIGVPAPEGTAEVLTVLSQALDAAGLKDYSIGFGDASLVPALLDTVGIDERHHDRIVAELAAGDFVAFEREVHELNLDPAQRDLLLRIPQIRGGPDVLEGHNGPIGEAVTGLRAVQALLAPEVAARIIFDLGLVRSLGYYTGAVFQVYDPAHGVPIGSGGRYDDTLAQFGVPQPAVGFALNVERMHIALTGEERGIRR